MQGWAAARLRVGPRRTPVPARHQQPSAHVGDQPCQPARVAVWWNGTFTARRACGAACQACVCAVALTTACLSDPPNHFSVGLHGGRPADRQRGWPVARVSQWWGMSCSRQDSVPACPPTRRVIPRHVHGRPGGAASYMRHKKAASNSPAGSQSIHFHVSAWG